MGMLYYGYRYYSPELGRWLSRDPIGERGGINLYGMVGNNPVNWWDYLGLSDFEHINGGMQDGGGMDLYMGLRNKGGNMVVETKVDVSWKPCPGSSAQAGSKTYGPIYSNLNGSSQTFPANGQDYSQITPIHTQPNDNDAGTRNWIDSLMGESAADRYCTEGSITVTIRYTSQSTPATEGLTGDNRNVFQNEDQHNQTGETKPSNFDQGQPKTETIKIKWNCKGEMTMESNLPGGPNRDGRPGGGTTIPPTKPMP
jgi:hypothetical protein